MSSIHPLPPKFNVEKSDVRRVISVLVATFIFATVIVALRFVSKRKLKASFLLEDWLILCASILAAGPQWTFIESAFTQELGRHVEYNGSNAQISFCKKIYACQMLYILAACLTKLSILAFYWRTFRPSQPMQVLIGGMVVVVICGSIGFFITSIFQCNSIHEVWDIPREGNWIDTYVFFLSNAAFNVFTNFSLLVLPLPSIWKLQIPQSKKFMISCLLTLGGLIIVISIVRLHSLIQLDLASADITSKMVFPVIWSGVEMQFSIFCSCLPFLRPLFAGYSQMYQKAAVTTSSAWRRLRRSSHSQKPTDSDEQETVVTRAWGGRRKSVDEEKWPQVIDKGRWSQEVDEGTWPGGIIVTTVIEWTIKERDSAA